MNRYFACFGLPGSFVLTMLLSLLSLISALTKPCPARWLCFAAMIMSSVGDIFLMRFRGLNRWFPNYFIWGAGAFMIAHIIYAFSYRLLAKSKGFSFMNGGVVIAILMILASIFYCLYLCKGSGKYSNFPLCVIYLLVIGINCASIFSYSWAAFLKQPWSILAAVGAVSFFISDFIIGLGLLANISRYDRFIWWYYPIGQFLIILFCR